MKKRVIILSLLLVGALLTAACRHYEDFEFSGTVVEREMCNSIQDMGYIIALDSPDSIGKPYAMNDTLTYPNCIVAYNADRILKKNNHVSGRIYYDLNHSKAECTYHFDRDLPETCFSKLQVDKN